MTSFLNGPADGQTLMLRHSPEFLRVTHDDRAKQEWDALDAPSDQPRIQETVYVYRLVEDKGGVHVCARGGKGGFFRMADYEYVAVQPDEETMRSARKWVAWCQQQNGAKP